MISCSMPLTDFCQELATIFQKVVEKSLLKWEIYLRAEQVIALFSQHLAHSGVGNHLPLYYLSVALAVPDLHVTLLSRCASGYNR